MVEGITVIADTYKETIKILQSCYRDKNRIIQAHLDYLQDIRSIHVIALRALGEEVNAYERVPALKVLQEFSENICRQYITYVKRQNISEGDICKLMKLLGEEKICGTTSFPVVHILWLPYTSIQDQIKDHDRQAAYQSLSVFSLNPTSNHCFLYLNRGLSAKDCTKILKGVKLSLSPAKYRTIDKFALTSKLQRTPPHIIEIPTSNYTYLQTAHLWVTEPTGLRKLTCCMMDGGSLSSFINSSLEDELKLEVVDHQFV
ncbi:hypothetical protein C0J52_22388 [Blattella germanica]|nr:hypothetical protein C0J52_22388 [Blattella germanica]